ncbi:UrcA family protein [Aurantiacibacter sp. MUD11]|uniref:UrcA family protein n=1 Tax=Aurantiacibacter sp. MUD11 TaxID=3003265 RepID=UPI0022AA0840|nr:UrcA family protein [Aurantiacibacter sp. MUD11]WAT18132.1 UrcA family protein [Aurantiacibacter sp. MUD11]
MKTISMKTGLAAAIAASAMIATPALADARDGGETVSVRYSDLDLSTQEGQSALQRRLNRAAEEVCGIDYRTSGRALPSSEARSCYAETIKTFEREIAVRAAEQQRG